MVINTNKISIIYPLIDILMSERPYEKESIPIVPTSSRGVEEIVVIKQDTITVVVTNDIFNAVINVVILLKNININSLIQELSK